MFSSLDFILLHSITYFITTSIFITSSISSSVFTTTSVFITSFVFITSSVLLVPSSIWVYHSRFVQIFVIDYLQINLFTCFMVEIALTFQFQLLIRQSFTIHY